MAPGQCSLWRDAKDTKVFAVCAGPPDSAQVLVMAADSVEEADKWVCSIAGRLYLSELQLEEEMITDYISIYYIFDTDGKGGISLDELQAASEGLGNPRSEHGHLTEELNATLTRLQIKTDAQGLISLPQFLKVCPLHDARVSRQGLPQPFPPISHTGAQGGAAAAICLGRGLAHAGLPLARRGRHGIDQPGGARSMVQRCARHGTHVHAHVHIHGPRAHAPAALPEAVLRGACPSSQGGRSHTIPLRHTMPLCAIRRNPMQALREKLTQKGFHRMTGQVPGGR